MDNRNPKSKYDSNGLDLQNKFGKLEIESSSAVELENVFVKTSNKKKDLKLNQPSTSKVESKGESSKVEKKDTFLPRDIYTRKNAKASDTVNFQDIYRKEYHGILGALGFLGSDKKIRDSSDFKEFETIAVEHSKFFNFDRLKELEYITEDEYKKYKKEDK